jgi:hypothetical protein
MLLFHMDMDQEEELLQLPEDQVDGVVTTSDQTPESTEEVSANHLTMETMPTQLPMPGATEPSSPILIKVLDSGGK